MRYLSLAICLVFAVSAFGAEIELKWDDNSGAWGEPPASVEDIAMSFENDSSDVYTLKTLRFKMTGGGSFDARVYSDNGAPDTELVSISSTGSSGWVDVDVSGSSIEIAAGDSFWVSCDKDGNVTPWVYYDTQYDQYGSTWHSGYIRQNDSDAWNKAENDWSGVGALFFVRCVVETGGSGIESASLGEVKACFAE